MFSWVRPPRHSLTGSPAEGLTRLQSRCYQGWVLIWTQTGKEFTSKLPVVAGRIHFLEDPGFLLAVGCNLIKAEAACSSLPHGLLQHTCFLLPKATRRASGVSLIAGQNLIQCNIIIEATSHHPRLSTTLAFKGCQQASSYKNNSFCEKTHIVNCSSNSLFTK